MSAIRPALATAYGAPYGIALSPAIDAMCTMLPLVPLLDEPGTDGLGGDERGSQVEVEHVVERDERSALGRLPLVRA